MYQKIRIYLQKYQEPIILFLIVCLNIISRLIRLRELFHFTYDESVFAFIGKRMIINHHIPLIGGVTPFHVHLAPYFYWISALFLSIFRLNPLGWGIITALISGITVLILYRLTREVFSNRVAYISIILYCFSVYINIFERHYWGLYLNPLLSLLIFLCLWKIINKSYKFFLLLGVVLGFAFHTDPSTIIFIPLIIFIVIKYKINFAKIPQVRLAVLIFAFSFLPLLIFDLRHNFVNISGLNQYREEVKSSSNLSVNQIADSLLVIPQFISRIIFIPGKIDLAQEYSYCPIYAFGKLNKVSPILAFSSLIILALIFLIKPLNQEAKIGMDIVKFFLLSTLFGVIIYKGLLGRPFFDHYLSTLIPIVVVILAIIIDRIFLISRKMGLLLIIFFILFNLYQLSGLNHTFGFSIKSQAIKWAINNVDEDFALESLSQCFKYNGYRYLFYYYGKEPIKSYVDQNLFYLFDELPKAEHPNELVVMVGCDYNREDRLMDLYNKYKKYLIKSRKFGCLEVLIIDNTKEILYDF